MCRAQFLSSTYILAYKMRNTWAFGNISGYKSFEGAQREKRCERENHEALYKNNSERERERERVKDRDRECFRKFYQVLYVTDSHFISFSNVDTYQHLLDGEREERPRLSGMRVAWVFAFF